MKHSLYIIHLANIGIEYPFSYASMALKHIQAPRPQSYSGTHPPFLHTTALEHIHMPLHNTLIYDRTGTNPYTHV